MTVVKRSYISKTKRTKPASFFFVIEGINECLERLTDPILNLPIDRVINLAIDEIDSLLTAVNCKTYPIIHPIAKDKLINGLDDIQYDVGENRYRIHFSYVN